MADKNQDFLELDLVKKAMEIGNMFIAQQVTGAYWWSCQLELSPTSPRRKVESPAEAVFAVAFLAHQIYERAFQLQSQVDVEANGSKYRFDFVVRAIPKNGKKPFDLPLAVEIDGHAFHEKTLDQVTRRNRRDRDVQCAGYTVMHFSFSELVADPMLCCEEVVEAANRMWERMAEASIPKDERGGD